MLRAAASERQRLQDPSRGSVDVRMSTMPSQSSAQPLNLFPAMVSGTYLVLCSPCISSLPWTVSGTWSLAPTASLPSLSEMKYVELCSTADAAAAEGVLHSKA